MIECVCQTDHRPDGTAPGEVIATFATMQEASNRGLEETYQRCDLEYREAVS